MTLRVCAGVISLATSLALAGTAPAGSADAARPPEVVPVRVGYTASIFRDIAESDARAAIKVWAEALAKETEIPASSEVEVLPDAESLAERLQTKRVDFGGMTTLEFLQIEKKVDLDPMFAVNRGGVATVEYLILVRRDSEYRQLTDLRGASLRVFDNPRCSLAIPWVEVLLSEQGIGSAEEFFGRVVPTLKLSAVVLPVFFGQEKACLVTRDGFQTMAELNPQVGRELRVLAESPSLIPMVSYFRRDFTPSFRQELIDAVRNLHASSAGKQILNLMQGDGVVDLLPSALDGTRELVQRWSHRGTHSGAQTTARRRSAETADGRDR